MTGVTERNIKPTTEEKRACYHFLGALGRVAEEFWPEPLLGASDRAEPAKQATARLLWQLLRCHAINAYAAGKAVAQWDHPGGKKAPLWTTTSASPVGHASRMRAQLASHWAYDRILLFQPDALSFRLRHLSIDTEESNPRDMWRRRQRFLERMRDFAALLRSGNPDAGGFISGEIAPEFVWSRRQVFLHTHVVMLWPSARVRSAHLQSLWAQTARRGELGDLPDESGEWVHPVKQGEAHYVRALLYACGVRFPEKEAPFRGTRWQSKILDPFWGRRSKQDVDPAQLWLILAFHSHRGRCPRWFGALNARTEAGQRRRASLRSWVQR